MELNDLKKLCCYTETKNNTQISYYYMDFVLHGDESKAKIAIRDSAIDALLDEGKIPQYNKIKDDIESGKFFENEIDSPFDSISTNAIVLTGKSSLKAKSIIINPSKIKSHKDIEDLVVNEWINTAKNSIITRELIKRGIDKIDMNVTNLDSSISPSRRLITKIVGVGNLIKQSSRIGPATTILVNFDILNHLMSNGDFFTKGGSGGTIAGFEVVYSDLVPLNHVVVLRNVSTINNSEFSIIVSVNEDDGIYYFSKGPRLNRMCAIFEII